MLLQRDYLIRNVTDAELSLLPVHFAELSSQPQFQELMKKFIALFHWPAILS